MKEKCYLKINPKGVEIVGDENEILALYGTLTHELLENGIKEEVLEVAFRLGHNSAENLEKATKEIIKERTDKTKQKLLETFKKLLFEEE